MSTMTSEREAFEKWAKENGVEFLAKNWRDEDIMLISIGKVFKLHKAAHLAQPAQVVDENSVNQALRDQEVEIATLREALREMILVHVVDDDAWDQAAETEQRMQRAIGAARSRITAHLGATHDHP